MPGAVGGRGPVGPVVGGPDAVEGVDASLALGVSRWRTTLSIVLQLVLSPRGRTLEDGLEEYAGLAADIRSRSVATVTSAIALDDATQERLAAALERVARGHITVGAKQAGRVAQTRIGQREVRVGVGAATLTLPQGHGPFPAAVMVHGAGATDYGILSVMPVPFFITHEEIYCEG